MNFLLRSFILIAATLAAPALAAPKKLTLGVFLPTALADGEARFQLSERMAKVLSDALGQPVVAKNFGRYEDYFAAASKGTLDIAVVDGWVALQAPTRLKPVGLAELESATHARWAVVSRERSTVKDLAGTRLVVPRSTAKTQNALVSNVVFQGDFDASRFKIIEVPNVESALKLLEVKGADAALLPAGAAPKGIHVAFRTQRLPQVVVLASQESLAATLTGLSAPPLSRFTGVNESELTGLRRLLEKGAPPRHCVMADSPIVPLDTARLVNAGELARVLPTFTEYLEIPKEVPDP